MEVSFLNTTEYKLALDRRQLCLYFKFISYFQLFRPLLPPCTLDLCIILCPHARVNSSQGSVFFLIIMISGFAKNSFIMFKNIIKDQLLSKNADFPFSA